MCRQVGGIARSSVFSFKFCLCKATQPGTKSKAFGRCTTVVSTACSRVNNPFEKTILTVIHRCDISCIEVFWPSHPLCQVHEEEKVCFVRVIFPLSFQKTECLTQAVDLDHGIKPACQGTVLFLQFLIFLQKILIFLLQLLILFCFQELFGLFTRLFDLLNVSPSLSPAFLLYSLSLCLLLLSHRE